MTTYSALYRTLLSAETDSERDADARRVIGAERQALYVALEARKAAAAAVRSAKSRPQSHRTDNLGRDVVAMAQRELETWEAALDRAAAEARRVALMWGVAYGRAAARLRVRAQRRP